MQGESQGSRHGGQVIDAVMRFALYRKRIQCCGKTERRRPRPRAGGLAIVFLYSTVGTAEEMVER